MQTQYSDKFGYLPFPFTLQFSGGRVTALPNLSKAIRIMEKRMHPNLYIYPIAKQKRSRRPGSFHRLPSTHTVELEKAFASQEQARYEDAGFVMHLLGFLYGHRCHFHGWWVDGKVLFPEEIDHSFPTAQQAENIISRSLQTWQAFGDRQRAAAINVLLLHTRTQVYDLQYERFSCEYQLFDAVYALAHPKEDGQAPHGKRIRSLCKDFEIPFEEELTKKIVDLRNDLLHEAIWDARMPGEARSDFSFYASLHLHKLTKRAILALLGLKGSYIKSSWSTLRTHRFDVDPG